MLRSVRGLAYPQSTFLRKPAPLLACPVLALFDKSTSHKLTLNLLRHNRYSMPVTKSRNGIYDTNLDQTNTTRFLFGDDEPNALPQRRTPDDNFPTLVRREDQMVSDYCVIA